MMVPAATYRIQFSAAFTFEDLKANLDYLKELGISTIYASPIFRAREGSTHGYDILDPYSLNPEIGNLEIFRKIRETLREKNMQWLQDIVPNHMAFSAKNPWLQDIFELGSGSEYYQTFDIDWKSSGKVMAPILGAALEDILEKNELKLQINDSGFSINYSQHSFPASSRSYPLILKKAGVGNWQEKFESFSGNNLQWEDLKLGFFREVQGDPDLQEGIRTALENINSSSEKMESLRDRQYFQPTHWRKTEKEINYRRFFTINDLICLNMQDQKVLESYHYFLKELVEQEFINGLRIDHIDGLYDPAEYLRALRKFIKEDLYIVVEKIQESKENLPEDWPMQGSTGYDFLARVNHLFTQMSSEKTFTKAYMKIAPDLPDYEKLVFEKKHFILKEEMGGELENLFQLLLKYQLLPEENKGFQGYKEALGILLSSFPVYRIYPGRFPLEEHQKMIIETAYANAVKQVPEKEEVLSYLNSILQGDAGKDKSKMLSFLQRCQQFTGPLAAKGVEDTTFYIYNRLLSHNEVGDSPAQFGISIQDFHKAMVHRQKSTPHTLNATATHDTKRGEDARMRLNVLSEIPEEWFRKVEEWQLNNESLKKDGGVPDPNSEYFIYQSLLGSYPFIEEELKDFPGRLKEYLQKAFREAKIHTTWATPDEVYETEISTFIFNMLKNEDFLRSFTDFHKKIAFYGVLKSLSQTLIKITAPGVPDIYQGTELWDLSFVDPDNRRPVNYELRKTYLKDIYQGDVNNKVDLEHLKTAYMDGRIKFLVMHKALRFRGENKELFAEGQYLPLQINGKNASSFIAYARKLQNKWAVIIAPVLVINTFAQENLTPLREATDDIEIILPDLPTGSWKNCLTDAELPGGSKFQLTEVLKDLPVALLTNSY